LCVLEYLSKGFQRREPENTGLWVFWDGNLDVSGVVSFNVDEQERHHYGGKNPADDGHKDRRQERSCHMDFLM